MSLLLLLVQLFEALRHAPDAHASGSDAQEILKMVVGEIGAVLEAPQITIAHGLTEISTRRLALEAFNV